MNNMLLAIFLCFSASINAQGYHIMGVLKGIGNTSVVLGNKGTGYTDAFIIKYYDTVESVNDTFLFYGSLLEPNFYSIEVPVVGSGWRYFILENTNIMITGHRDSISKAKVAGSKQFDLFQNFRINIQRPLALKGNEFSDSCSKARKLKDTLMFNKYVDSNRFYFAQIDNKKIEFILSNSTEFCSLFFLDQLEISNIYLDTMKYLFASLSADLQNSRLGKSIQNSLFSYSVVGNQLPNLIALDESLLKIQLPFKDKKYHLIIFWASWCGPCIKEIPDLEELYEKGNELDLDIISISIDNEEKKWKEAIIKHGIPWKNYWDFDLVEGHKILDQLSISSIPQNILLNKDGKILTFSNNLDEVKEKLKL